MLEPYKNREFGKSKKCAGLYIWKDEGKPSYASLVILNRRRERTNQLSTIVSTNLADIIKEIPRAVPLLVALDGLNVIHKILPEHVATDQQVNYVLPGAKAKDFFICRQTISEERIILSLVRHSEVEQLVKDLNSAGLLIWDITLGPFVLAEFKDILKGSDSINIPYYSFLIKNNEIFDFTRIPLNTSVSSHEISFEDDLCSTESLVPLANCLSFFSGSSSHKISPLLDTQRKEYKARRILNTVLLPSLILILAALFLNFFLFMKYEKETSEIDNTMLIKANQLTEIDSLKKIITAKQQILDKKLNSDARYLVYFSDRIGSVIPLGIRLQEMVINPQMKLSSASKSYEFDSNRINIVGITDNTISLEIFVKRLSSYKWIKDTNILSFNETKDGVKSFSLDLELSDL